MHLMNDFETLGDGADSIVVSLGSVAFNKEGIIGEREWKFNILDQQKLGRTFSASTLAWWMKQSDQARSVFHSEDKKFSIEEFFPDFELFVSQCFTKVEEKWDEVKPWGNGANFDISILEDLYRRHHRKRGEAIPWRYWNVKCFRTFNDLTGCKKLLARPHGTHHTALGDSRHQAQCVLAYWKAQEIKKGKK